MLHRVVRGKTGPSGLNNSPKRTYISARVGNSGELVLCPSVHSPRTTCVCDITVLHIMTLVTLLPQTLINRLNYWYFLTGRARNHRRQGP